MKTKEAGIYNKPTPVFKMQSFVKFKPVKVGLQSRSSRSSWYSGSINERKNSFRDVFKNNKLNNPYRNEV